MKDGKEYYIMKIMTFIWVIFKTTISTAKESIYIPLENAMKDLSERMLNMAKDPISMLMVMLTRVNLLTI